MTEIKVSATFLLQGRTLVAEKPISRKGKTKEEFQALQQEYARTHKQECINLGKQGIINIWVRDGKPVTQKMNLSKEAYSYMISSESYAGIATKNDWNHYSKTKKLKLHLMDIAQSINAKLLDFAVLED